MPLRSAARLAAILSTLALLGAGCTTPPSKGLAAAPESLTRPPNPALRESVAVDEVQAGEASRLGLPSVSSGELAQALTDSLRRAGYLAPSAGAARYALDAYVEEAALQNGDGLFRNLQTDDSVTSTIRYRLRDVQRSLVLLDRKIEVPYTAANRTGFFTATRVRVADEGSVRESIESLLDELGRLRITAGDDGQGG